MPIQFNKPALRDLHTQLVGQGQNGQAGGASAPKGTELLDKLVSIVGDRAGGFLSSGVSSADIARQLQGGTLSLEQKLSIAKKGLDASEASDIKAMLQDPAFAGALDGVTRNFLSALVGLEPLKNVDSMQTGGTTAVRADTSRPEVQAAQKFRDIINSGQLKKYYDAALGVGDASLQKEALDLFNALPAVKPGMAATDFVKAGLWTTAPRGVELMQKSARYLPGRQVLIETTVHSSVPKRSESNYESERKLIGSFKDGGVKAVTHRATLVGDDPQNKNNFLVKVDGKDTPVSIPKSNVYEHNQPHELSSQHVRGDKRDLPYNWEKWHIDYNSPLAKAKLCEVAIAMDKLVGQLDFTKSKTEASGGAIGVMFGRGQSAKAMVDIQKQCNEIIFRSIDMKYPQGRPFTDAGRAPQGDRDAARQAIRGTGMCVQQSSVYGALLMPFADILGIDGQYRSGNCYRNINGATDNVFRADNSTGHGWWQVTFRPSMEVTVTDRTWNQVNLPLDRAYGFPYGDRYADRNINGYRPAKVKDTDVNVSGSVTVESIERQFSQAGDGRENHISNTQGR